MPVKEIAGAQVDFDDEGFMTNPEQWTKEIAAALAKAEGVDTLMDGHWKVIDFMRNDFNEKGQPSTIRRINKVGGVPIKDLYTLFPKGPAKKAAKIAGLGKPQGCV